VPPRRLDPEPAALLLASYVFAADRIQKAPCVSSCLSPTAYPDPKALLFTPLERKRPDIVALISGSHILGFGYPLDASFNFRTLGSLFQPPTLLGFSPQSLSPSKWSEKSFLFPLRSCAFPNKHFSLSSALQRFDPTRKAVPLYRSPKV